MSETMSLFSSQEEDRFKQSMSMSIHFLSITVESVFSTSHSNAPVNPVQVFLDKARIFIIPHIKSLFFIPFTNLFIISAPLFLSFFIIPSISPYSNLHSIFGIVSITCNTTSGAHAQLLVKKFDTKLLKNSVVLNFE